MGQKFLISEQEKFHIKKLYGLITEAVEPYTQSQRVTFNPGYYGEQYAAPFLDPIIENIKKYLTDRPGERFVVNVSISSGESRIPNTDNEGTIKGKGQRLDPGVLALERTNTIQKYLNRQLSTLVPNILPKLPDYTKSGPFIGKTSWVGTPFCPKGSSEEEQRSGCVKRYRAGMDSTYSSYKKAYNDEQYLDMSITITEEPKKITEECSDNITIRFEVKNHSCQNAEFFVFANNTRLNNVEGGMTANLNTGAGGRGIPSVSSSPIFPKELLNPGYGILTRKYKESVKGKTKEQVEASFKNAVRWDDFQIPLSKKEEILSQSITNENKTPFINIWFECTTDTAHDDIVTITIYDGSGKPIINPFQPTGKKEGLLCTLDKCGKPIKTSNPSVGPSESDVATARQELISYKSNLMNSLGLSADTTNLDSKGLEQEKAQSLLDNINDVVKKFNESFKLIDSEFTKVNKEWNKIDEKTRKFILSQGDTFNLVHKQKINLFFQKSFDSDGYKPLLRKDPLDPNSYRRGLITSDMGIDLKTRMNTFYDYFNLFYKVTDGDIGILSFSNPKRYYETNKLLSNIKK